MNALFRTLSRTLGIPASYLSTVFTVLAVLWASLCIHGVTYACDPDTVSTYPFRGQRDIPQDVSVIWARFDQSMDSETINAQTFHVCKSGNPNYSVAGSVEYVEYQEGDEDIYEARFIPSDTLRCGPMIYFVFLSAYPPYWYDTIFSADHCPLDATEWSFHTDSCPPPPPCDTAISAESDFTNTHAYPEDSSQSETSIAVNPNDPSDILVGSNIGSAKPDTYTRQGWYQSLDTTISWQHGRIPEGSSDSRLFDPVVAFDGQDHAYYCYGWQTGCVLPPDSPQMSCDSGKIMIRMKATADTVWGTAYEATSGDYGPDKPHMAVDLVSSGGTRNDIYVAWTEMGSRDVDTDPWSVIFTRSQDGMYFAAPQSISDNIASDTGGCFGVNLAVGPDSSDGSRLYACWGIQEVANGDVTSIGFNSSNDGGANWEGATTIVDDVVGIRASGLPPKSFRAWSLPSMAVDTSCGGLGIIYLVWADKRNSDADVFLVRSFDGGVSWPDAADPIRVNCDTPQNGADQWFPWVTVDPGGGVNVVFYDCRGDLTGDTTNFITEVWVARSVDSGGTFRDFRVSDVAFSPCPVDDNYMGDYIGIASVKDGLYACWNDNRYVPDGEVEGVHQVHVARVPLLNGNVAENISIDRTWLMSGDVTIDSGVTLTISPPGKILIDPGTNRRMDVYGSLQIIGTETDSVVLGSAADSPTDNDWFGIVHHGTGNLTMEYARVENAYKGVWIVDTAAPTVTATIDHCEFRDGYMSGVWVEADTLSSITISNSSFEDIDYYGVQIYKGMPTVEGNTFTGSMLNGVRVEGSGTRIAGGKIRRNTFDDLTSSAAIGVNLQSLKDQTPDGPTVDTILDHNVFGPNWSNANQTAIQVYDCPDTLKFYMNRITGDDGDLPGYGILNFNTRTLINGDNDSTESKSRIRDCLYGLYCFSSMDTLMDYAVVRECSFRDNSYSVYMYEDSRVDLGIDSLDRGNNLFDGYCKDNCGGNNFDAKHTVWVDGSTDTAFAQYNYWVGLLCTRTDTNECWPFTGGSGTVLNGSKLSLNPFMGLLKVAAQGTNEETAAVSAAVGPINYPNPFNASTVIRFALEQTGPVDVAVYNILGQQVKVLTSGVLEAGHHEIPWDA